MDKIEITYEEQASGHYTIHRAKIKFADGPHGTVFTEWYMGKHGAEIVVQNFEKIFSKVST